MIFEKEGEILSLEMFETLTGAKWSPKLEFSESSLIQQFREQAVKKHQKGKLSREQLWFGRYFQKELERPESPDLCIRWIDPMVGWGVFAGRNFKKMEFIAEYYGQVRKRKRADAKNSYCFEYRIAQEEESPYLIDASEQGAVARYINHSSKVPNLQGAIATLDFMSHVILYAKEPIAKGAQLCYDYGPDYWAKRSAPNELLSS